VQGDPDDHHAALREIARIHREWSTRVDEALALGAHDRRSPSVLPHTLVHGDFHAGNVIGSTIIDWSDAAIANPLFDVNHYLLDRRDDERDALIATYSEAWPEHDVPAALAACEAETYEYVARSYALITDALAEDDRWWFAGEEERWLRRAADVRAGRRPTPDT
jgi:aminoglycoside phosphotransferase (APT) family kinase protein